MRTFYRYIFSQVFLAALCGVVLFIVIWISPEILFRIIKQTVYGEITPVLAFKLFFLEIPEILGKAIPVGLMLGGLFVFDRLSRDFEVTIFRSIGISIIRIIYPVFVISLFATLICFITYDRLIPYANSTIKQLKNDIHKSHFVYVDKTDSGKPKHALIVGNYNGKKIKDIKLLTFSESISDNAPLIKNIVMANYAIYDGSHWILKEGINYYIASSGVYENIKNFDKMEVFSKDISAEAHSLLVYSTKKSSEMQMCQLKEYLSLLKSANIKEDFRYILSKIHQRYAQAFSCIFLAICGVLLGFSKPGEKRIFGFTAAAAIIFIYYIIRPFLDMLAQTGIIAPVVAAWIPNIIVLISILLIIRFRQI